MNSFNSLYQLAYTLMAQVELGGGGDASSALANGSAGGAGAPPPIGACGGTESMFLMVGMLVLFYFLLIRPQSKKMKEHKAMVEALKRGDNVITSSGIYGRIDAVEGNVLLVEIAKGTKIRILKNYVGGVANAVTEEELSKSPQAGAN